MPNANEEMENQCRGDRSTVCMNETHGDLRLCNTTFGYSRSDEWEGLAGVTCSSRKRPDVVRIVWRRVGFC